MTAPKPVSGGIKLLVRKAPTAAAATAGVGRLSLDEKKPAAPAKGPSELFAELLEAAGGDVGAAAARIKELLAAGSRDAAALGGLALREGVPALHTHGGSGGSAGAASATLKHPAAVQGLPAGCAVAAVHGWSPSVRLLSTQLQLTRSACGARLPANMCTGDLQLLRCSCSPPRCPPPRPCACPSSQA